MTADALLDRLANTVDAAWLCDQRWFRAKQRGIRSVAPHDLAPMDELGTWLVVLTVRYQEGPEERYLLPVIVHGQELREPGDGDGAWRTLARLMLAGGELPGRRGAFVFAPTAASARVAPGGAATVDALGERRLGVEQSNTSVVLGDRLILKLYRLLESGENPDLELGAFLNEAGFAKTPMIAGAASYLPDDGASCAVAMLQSFVASDGDGWTWALDGLAAPGQAGVLEGMAQIGNLTDEMHTALASRPEDPGFPVRAALQAERAGWREGAEAQLDGALGAVNDEARERLARLAPKIRGRLAALESSGEPITTRIHGDYHLGQLLRTAGGFMVIDFEGEPARPLLERRQPTSPLRDVAGMLRSFDYAVRTAQRAGGGPADVDAWLRAARDAFLSAYGRIGDDQAELLAAFELEKACYEVRYEANNRPDWTWLPLDALERLAA